MGVEPTTSQLQIQHTNQFILHLQYFIGYNNNGHACKTVYRHFNSFVCKACSFILCILLCFYRLL